MKKMIALLLAAVMALGCAAAMAEDTTITSADGNFSLSFQLAEGMELLSGSWVDENNYMANIRAGEGLYLYLAVAAPFPVYEGEDEETGTVTYNEDNGYTDEYMKEMVEELYKDDASDFDIGVATTKYGTKLAVVRFNDTNAPGAYVFTVWNGYEIGLTLASVTEEQTYRTITDEQVDMIVDFVSELWMTTKEAAE